MIDDVHRLLVRAHQANNWKLEDVRFDALPDNAGVNVSAKSRGAPWHAPIFAGTATPRQAVERIVVALSRHA